MVHLRTGGDACRSDHRRHHHDHRAPRHVRPSRALHAHDDVAGERGWYAVAILTAPLLMLATLFTLSLISPAFLPGIFTTGDRMTLSLASLGVGLSAGIFE